MDRTFATAIIGIIITITLRIIMAGIILVDIILVDIILAGIILAGIMAGIIRMHSMEVVGYCHNFWVTHDRAKGGFGRFLLSSGMSSHVIGLGNS